MTLNNGTVINTGKFEMKALTKDVLPEPVFPDKTTKLEPNCKQPRNCSSSCD
ncbi:hypothetical protein JCM19236_6109 [Vibrio sp. JCM 19236]|nr:hypothetical protein JCM19236_6109 [Vibrio sp. JCM 19236]